MIHSMFFCIIYSTVVVEKSLESVIFVFPPEIGVPKQHFMVNRHGILSDLLVAGPGGLKMVVVTGFLSGRIPFKEKVLHLWQQKLRQQ